MPEAMETAKNLKGYGEYHSGMLIIRLGAAAEIHAGYWRGITNWKGSRKSVYAFVDAKILTAVPAVME